MSLNTETHPIGITATLAHLRQGEPKKETLFPSAGKYTPGPWKAGRQYSLAYSETDGVVITAGSSDDDTDVWVAECNGINVRNVDNARLIAAAPELLTYLKTFVRICKQQDIRLGPLVHDAAELIARAEGRQP